MIILGELTSFNDRTLRSCASALIKLLLVFPIEVCSPFPSVPLVAFYLHNKLPE